MCSEVVKLEIKRPIQIFPLSRSTPAAGDTQIFLQFFRYFVYIQFSSQNFYSIFFFSLKKVWGVNLKKKATVKRKKNFWMVRGSLADSQSARDLSNVKKRCCGGFRETSKKSLWVIQKKKKGPKINQFTDSPYGLWHAASRARRIRGAPGHSATHHPHQALSAALCDTPQQLLDLCQCSKIKSIVARTRQFEPLCHLPLIALLSHPTVTR